MAPETIRLVSQASTLSQARTQIEILFAALSLERRYKARVDAEIEPLHRQVHGAGPRHANERSHKMQIIRGRFSLSDLKASAK